MAKKRRGKLIVIDGADGTGKATQTALLLKRLKREGYRVRTLDFPQYEKNFFGKFLGDCLAGKHGDFLALDPYFASVFYDLDRFESKESIRRSLERECIVVLDRYVSANQIHQGAKIADARKRTTFLRWLARMEFEVLGLPKPDLTIYLSVPYRESRKLLRKKDNRHKKTYLGGKQTDLAEGNASHQKAARKYIKQLVSSRKGLVKVECMESGALLSKAAIHKRVWKKVRNVLH